MPFVLIILIIAGSAMFKNYSTDERIRTAIESGLEECPNLRSGYSTSTIWVKNCDEFMSSYKKNIRKKELR